MQISEIFHSIQGEGMLAGTPSVFIRTSICNLRCWWCDTPYTSWAPELEQMTVSQIYSRVRHLAANQASPSRHVVITGGEPLLQRHELPDLCAILSADGYHCTIETNATIFIPLRAQLISMSPKLSNSTPRGKFERSHERYRLRPDVISQYLELYRPPDANVQFKFVIDSENDLIEVERLAQQASIPLENILLMPQAREQDELREKTEWLKTLCQRRGYRLSPRLHIELFGNRRGV
ncbi:MAG: 7-carboxy-7-deazaguanine synthase QueE [bacterium]